MEEDSLRNSRLHWRNSTKKCRRTPSFSQLVTFHLTSCLSCHWMPALMIPFCGILIMKRQRWYILTSPRPLSRTKTSRMLPPLPKPIWIFYWYVINTEDFTEDDDKTTMPPRQERIFGDATTLKFMVGKVLVQTHGLKIDPLCMSVAFDWMFLGCSDKGINREVSSCLEASMILWQMTFEIEKAVKCLAIPVSSLLTLPNRLWNPFSTKGTTTNTKSIATKLGILPSVQYLVKAELKAI